MERSSDVRYLEPGVVNNKFSFIFRCLTVCVLPLTTGETVSLLLPVFGASTGVRFIMKMIAANAITNDKIPNTTGLFLIANIREFELRASSAPTLGCLRKER